MLRGVTAAFAWLASCVALQLHTRLVLPLLSCWETGLEQAEESTKAFIREAFGLIASGLNDAGSWVLSAVDASYSDTQRRASQQQQAWQSWWREDRTSTLNAVVANAHPQGTLSTWWAGHSREKAACAPCTEPGQRCESGCAFGVGSWRLLTDNPLSSPQCKHNTGSLKPNGSFGSMHGVNGGGRCVGVNASANATTKSAARTAPPAANGGGRHHPYADDTAPGVERSWFMSSLDLMRRRLSSSSSSSRTTTDDGSAASPSASQRQVQHIFSTSSGQPSQPPPPQPSALARLSRRDARRDYAKRREERTAAFEAAGWWGVHEALNRTGLLEDARLSMEVAVTRVFDWLRWLVRSTMLSLKPAAAAEGRDAAAARRAAAAAAAVEPMPRFRRGGAGSPDRAQPPVPLELRRRRRQHGDSSEAGSEQQQQQGTAGDSPLRFQQSRLRSPVPHQSPSRPPSRPGGLLASLKAIGRRQQHRPSYITPLTAADGDSEEEEEEEEDDEQLLHRTAMAARGTRGTSGGGGRVRSRSFDGLVSVCVGGGKKHTACNRDRVPGTCMQTATCTTSSHVPNQATYSTNPHRKRWLTSPTQAAP